MSIATPIRDEFKTAILDLLPDQGCWSENQYLAMTDYTTRLVEFTDGYIEQLPLPTDLHQSIAEFFLFAFTVYLKPIGGKRILLRFDCKSAQENIVSLMCCW